MRRGRRHQHPRIKWLSLFQGNGFKVVREILNSLTVSRIKEEGPDFLSESGKVIGFDMVEEFLSQSHVGVDG